MYPMYPMYHRAGSFLCIIGIVSGCSGDDLRSNISHHSADKITLPADEQLPCRVALRSTGISLRPESDGNHPDPGLFIRRDSRGRYFTTTNNPGEIALWSTSGSFRESVGRAGEGPGDFGGIKGLTVDDSGSAHVFHARTSWTIIEPDLHVMDRTSGQLLIHADAQTVALSKDQILVALRADDIHLQTFYLLDHDGAVERSFEVAHPIRRSLRRPKMTRVPKSNAVWTGPWIGADGSYALTQISLVNDQMRTITGSLSYLAYDTATNRGRNSDILPAFELYALADSLLYFGVMLAGSPSRSAPRTRYYFIIDVTRLLVVAAGVWTPEQYVSGLFPGTDLANRWHLNENGMPMHDIIRITLQPKGGSNFPCRQLVAQTPVIQTTGERTP